MEKFLFLVEDVVHYGLNVLLSLLLALLITTFEHLGLHILFNILPTNKDVGLKVRFSEENPQNFEGF